MSFPVRSLRILVVDDNVDSADILGLLLARQSHTVYVAYDGASAVRLAADVHPEVCCIDISMPGIDGYETARRIAAEPWAVKILLIAVSAKGAPGENLIEGSAFTHQLDKPMNSERLYSLVEQLKVTPRDSA